MITIREFEKQHLPAFVELINEADAVDKMDRITSLEQEEHDISFPSYHPETDCFLAWDGERLVGYASLWVGRDDNLPENTIYCSGVVHPQWRRQGVGARLLRTGARRAREIMAGLPVSTIHLQCSAGEAEEGRLALFEEYGMSPIRYFVNLERSLGNGLKPAQVPDGIRLRTYEPEQDLEAVLRVANAAFSDHWGHSEVTAEDMAHWSDIPYMRPELWFLAEEEESGEAVGLGLNFIDPDWIARTGRREGYVDTLAVVREHRHRGLGTALLVHSLQALQEAGMEGAHLHADSANPTGAVRIYERAGFQVRKKTVAYRKTLRT